MAKFKYYTIYRCKNCRERIRVHGKLTSRLVLPPGIQMCCEHPRLQRERQILISKYDTKKDEVIEAEREASKQKSLTEYRKD